ncbi:MarR family transcriptional regulator [Cytobacillus oceanisediminis]|uniref:MarR family transcriptional regulator n=1 Tax=Niallia circulans TaxID=1397 RepID=A0A941GI80_NIACI|nr:MULTISPECIES: MarR family transcriptional regulator [Bacillaceae]MBZ9534652.1 MarR family transcriptional regulator [Cytobacillus oceanisediminis]MCB5236459.1 MarR family transcriptional regulator [Niallia circulans]MDU1844746.1 MarR family transcriptional regulator [Niallia nealsonii]UTI43132.1 MarR family transcriptional regulator [Niallia sp. RD1]
MKTSQRFFQQLLLLYRPFENKLVHVLGTHHIQRAQWTILFYLYEYGSATLVELSSYQGVEKPTITRTIQQLEALGYVEQMTSQDKREKRMQLTELGKETYLTVRIAVDKFEEEIVHNLTENDLKEAIQIMSSIRNNLLK